MGSGFKDWSPGDVLTAADVDGYLMRQTVMTFADASARDTALSGVLDEGMVAYLEDSNAITVYNGSAWVSVIDSDVLTVDTSNNRVGVNDSTPSYALDVTGDINATGDLRIGGTAIGDPVSFTPTFTSGVTVGNGTVDAYYWQVNNLVFWRMQFELGSTSAITGPVIIEYPVASIGTHVNAIGGSVFFDDANSTDFYGFLYRNNSAQARVVVGDTSSTYLIWANLSSTVPFTWATGDKLVIEDWYSVQ